MTNWVSNKIRFSDKEDLKRCLNDEGKFSFENFIPSPKNKEEAGEYYLATKEDFEKAHLEYDPTICYNWYTWNCKHWHTKCDACDVEIGDDYVTFDTAWAFPIPIIYKIAKLCNDRIDVYHAYEDEYDIEIHDAFYKGELIESHIKDTSVEENESAKA